MGFRNTGLRLVVTSFVLATIWGVTNLIPASGSGIARSGCLPSVSTSTLSTELSRPQPYTDFDPYTQTHSHQYCDVNLHSNRHRDRHTQSNRDSDPDSQPYADLDTDLDADASADTDVDYHPSTHADPHGNATAEYQHADANAHP